MPVVEESFICDRAAAKRAKSAEKSNSRSCKRLELIWRGTTPSLPARFKPGSLNEIAVGRELTIWPRIFFWVHCGWSTAIVISTSSSSLIPPQWHAIGRIRVGWIGLSPDRKLFFLESFNAPPTRMCLAWRDPPASIYTDSPLHSIDSEGGLRRKRDCGPKVHGTKCWRRTILLFQLLSSLEVAAACRL